MTDLIERLEKATGPDRELGNDVLLACGWKIEEHGNGGPDTYLVWVAPDQSDDQREGDHPDPTASIDAALTLVPEGLYWMTGLGKRSENEPLGGAGTFLPGDDEPYTLGEGRTAAIALCIAALKARAHSAGKGEGWREIELRKQNEVLRAALMLAKDRLYNAFEPDNQSETYMRITSVLATLHAPPAISTSKGVE